MKNLLNQMFFSYEMKHIRNDLEYSEEFMYYIYTTLDIANKEKQPRGIHFK